MGVELVNITTDPNGRFELDNIASGQYAVHCLHPDSALSAFKKISITDTLSTSCDTFFLQEPGSINGVVTRGGIPASSGNLNIRDGDIRVVILDINESTITGPDGFYSFSGLPPGTYSLAFYPGGNFFSTTRSNIAVMSGSVNVIDTVLLQPIPWVEPPKPEDLAVEYDTVNSTVILDWKPVAAHNLLGYVVERRVDISILDPVEFFTRDTFYLDSVSGIPAGTKVYYTVRSISVQFVTSYPEGPGIITIAQSAASE